MAKQTKNKPVIAIVGAGRLGTALALELTRAGYRVNEIISRSRSKSIETSRQTAHAIKARLSAPATAILDASVVWFCVPDREIAVAARELATSVGWSRKTVFHSSGALASDELAALIQRGARAAAIHPFMTFVAGSIPSLRGVPFALEGNSSALRVAKGIVRDLGGDSFTIRKQVKIAYHAWGTFASPLLVALLVVAEEVACAAGIPAKLARKRMLPILTQTLANYAKLGPEGAFSGPIIRGDAETVRQHIAKLKKIPEAKGVYVALARAALTRLPGQNRKKVKRVLGN